MKTIEQNETYTLNLEFMGKRQGGWWLELIDRASGGVKILMHQNKTMFDGVTIDHAIKWTKDQEFQPMYKRGKM